MILRFFVISIFAVVKERTVNCNCIFMLFFGICFSFFGVLIRAILVQVCQSCNFNNASPFLFCSFESINLLIYQSIKPIYLPTGNPPTNFSIRSYLSKFSKGSFISQNSTIRQNRLLLNSDSNKGFIRALLGCVDMYCHQKLLSYIMF